MSSPLDPISVPRIDPVTAPLHLKRRTSKDEDSNRRQHSDESRDDRDGDEEDGLHVDVLA